MSLRILSIIAAVLLSTSAATAQPCPGGTCPSPFGIRIPHASATVARASSAVLSRPVALRGHPVRTFFADRRGIRTVFLRK